MTSITVFTPTYNRAYIISNLYESLKNQTCKDFEWLIVDDGSTDETETLVKDFIDNNDFPIRYIKQNNGGKHRAINRGVIEANGDLFFIVDSDDYLLPNAIELIQKHFEEVKNIDSIAGVVGFRCYPNGAKICKADFDNCFNCNRNDFVYKMGHYGDLAEAYKTSVLKKYPFPDFIKENFCAESLIWNRISLNYNLHFFNDSIYVCDYLPDGLTKNSLINRHKSPTYAITIYSESLKLNIPIKFKIKNAINYWRYYFDKHVQKIYSIYFIWYLFIPIGFLYNKIDLIKTKKNL